MREEATPAGKPSIRVPASKTITAEGWGTRLDVRHGLLRVVDGQDDEAEPFLLPRSRVKGLRVVVLGRAGTISIEALRWVADAGAVFALIDAAAGRVVCSSVDVGTADARIRRAQALAGVPPSPVGLEIARYLIGKKIEGELWVLRNDFNDREREAEQLRDALENTLPKATTVQEIGLLESQAAALYWSCFADVELHFARKDEARIPAHWRRFGLRASAITGSPRLASNPANAGLNYLNALAEVECRVALLTLGADPTLGIVHRDAPSRNSFALDLIEAVRPWIESFLLDLYRSRVFAKHDFHETERGVFRVGAALARQLAETMPAWRQLIAAPAEHVVSLIASSVSGRIRVPSKLTQSNRLAGRDEYRRKAARQEQTRARVAERMVAKRCRLCGTILDNPKRTTCDECLPTARSEAAETRAAAGRNAQARARAAGADPSHGGNAGRKRGAANARRKAEVRAWSGPPDETFPAEILPALAQVPLSVIVERTGLSRSYASLIRRGLYVPHPRWWPVLQELADEATKTL